MAALTPVEEAYKERLIQIFQELVARRLILPAQFKHGFDDFEKVDEALKWILVKGNYIFNGDGQGQLNICLRQDLYELAKLLEKEAS